MSTKSWCYGNLHDISDHVIMTTKKQDGGVRKTKCVTSNDCTHASINHTVTF